MNRYQCPGCGYVYDEAEGDAHEGFPPGTPKDAIPDSYSCPDCGVRDFVDFVKGSDTYPTPPPSPNRSH